MKKKLVISFTLIISFIFILSGILILNNKGTNTTVDKEVKTDNKEDTTWQEEYLYHTDKKNKYLLLSKYNGNSKDIVIPASAVIEGIEYKTMLNHAERLHALFTDDEINSLTLEDGVVMPPHLFYTVHPNAKKMKIGKLDLTLLDSTNTNNRTAFRNVKCIFSATEELDLTDFDNRDMKLLSSYINLGSTPTSCISAPKIILGKNVILKKDYNSYTSKLIPEGILLRNGTDEVYTGEELADVYDGSTMAGAYTVYSGNYVSYKPNGTEGYVASKKIDSSTKTISNPFERYGYTFVEWNTSSDGTGTSYSEGEVINNITEPITLYAIWNKTNNEELNTKKITIKYHYNKEDDKYYDIAKTKIRFKLRVKYDGKPYTDPIEYKSFQQNLKAIQDGNKISHEYVDEETTGTLDFKDGFYSFDYAQAKDEFYYELNLPENSEYEIIPYIKSFYEVSADKKSGNLTQDIIYDFEVKENKWDMIIYSFVIDPYDQNIFGADFSIQPSNLKKDVGLKLKYDGSINGEVCIDNSYGNTCEKESRKIPLEDNGLFVIHDFPMGAYLASPTPTTYGSELGYFVNYGLNESSYLGYNGFNLELGYEYKNFSRLGIEKTGTNLGVEDKKYKFKITTEKTVNRILTGKFPYELYNDNNELIDEGFVTFDSNGVSYVEVGLNETMYIGKDPNIYDKGNYLYDIDGVFPNEMKYQVEEVEDFNKYFKNLPSTASSAYLHKISNIRNSCYIRFTKNFEVNKDDITYASIENKLSESYKAYLKSSAIEMKKNSMSSTTEFYNFLRTNLDDDIYNKFLKENSSNFYITGDYNEIKKMVSDGKITGMYLEIYEENKEYINTQLGLSNALEYWKKILIIVKKMF